jgi:prepilin-type N-terminal cleavage/methylation domain-containing protein
MQAKRALTLVELLVSLSIAAMLAVAALQATASLARSERVLRREAERPEHLRAALETVVGADLIHAHHFRETAGGFAVQTHGRLAPGTLRLEHVPAEVTYQVRKVAERPYLVRLQRAADQEDLVELAAAGVRQVRLVPAKPVNANAEGWRPIAGPCVVRLEFDDAGAQTLEIRRPETGPN